MNGSLGRSPVVFASSVNSDSVPSKPTTSPALTGLGAVKWGAMLAPCQQPKPWPEVRPVLLKAHWMKYECPLIDSLDNDSACVSSFGDEVVVGPNAHWHMSLCSSLVAVWYQPLSSGSTTMLLCSMLRSLTITSASPAA